MRRQSDRDAGEGEASAASLRIDGEGERMTNECKLYIGVEVIWLSGFCNV